MTVAERMKSARKRLKKSQTDIANELGVTQPTISAYESGRALPDTKDVRAVANAYGLEPEQLLPEAVAS